MNKMYEGFDPVKIEKIDDGVRLYVWERVYEFKNSFVPTDVTVFGESIVSEPIRLNAHFEFGEVKEWTDFTYMIHEESDEKVVVLVSAGCENVIGNATVTIEPDGFVKIDFRLMNYWFLTKDNSKFARLQGLDMTVDIKNEYSSLFHFWPNAKSSILPEPIFNAGKTEDINFCFKPYAWTGNEKLGLGIFFGDTAEPFEVYDENKYIEVKKGEEATQIKLHMLDHMPFNWIEQGDDKWVETLETKFFTFGFQATPVKPMPKTKEEINKVTHILHTRLDVIDSEGLYGDEIYERAAKAGTKIFAFHEDWTAIQNYGYPFNPERFKKIVKKCHDLGMKVMVYFGYEYSSLAPDFSEKAHDYIIKMPSGNFAGGWQRKPLQRAFMTCYNSGYADVLIERVKYVMDELGVDGIYTDSTYIPHDCANTSHGCGYYDREGKLQPTFTVLATRNLVKRLYQVVHERGGFVDSHQSACCIMPVLSFCDSYFDGENIQGQVKQKQLRLDAFQCEYTGRNWGLPANFLAYTNDNFTMENMLAIPIIHNVMPRVCHHNDMEYMGKVWKIFDEYELHDAPFVYYYENDEVTAEEGAYVSLYKSKETVAVVCNLDDKRDETKIFGDYKKATELMSGKTYDFINGEAIVETGNVKFRIFKLDK